MDLNIRSSVMNVLIFPLLHKHTLPELTDNKTISTKSPIRDFVPQTCISLNCLTKHLLHTSTFNGEG